MCDGQRQLGVEAVKDVPMGVEEPDPNLNKTNRLAMRQREREWGSVMADGGWGLRRGLGNVWREFFGSALGRG